MAQWKRHLTTNQGISGLSPGKIVTIVAFSQSMEAWKTLVILVALILLQFHWPCGLTDKASDFESEDSGFDS